MAAKYENVYQFKITLDGIKPTIWRRIQVPETYTFWDLHVAIQDAMGWMHCHLHEFQVTNPKTACKDCVGIPEDDAFRFSDETRAGWKLKISQYFYSENKKARYVYDFGDGWKHSIVLEAIFPRGSQQQEYPCCVDGKNACPPEDCGGVPGYYNFIEIMKDPENDDHQEMVRWHGGHYDPKFFNRDVSFSSPSKRLKELLSGY